MRYEKPALCGICDERIIYYGRNRHLYRLHYMGACRECRRLFILLFDELYHKDPTIFPPTS